MKDEKMKEKKSLETTLKNNKVIRIVICVISVVMLFALYIPTLAYVKNSNMKKLAITTDNEIMVEVESLKEKNGILQLTGWGLKFNARNEEITLLLQEVGGAECKVLTTKLTEHGSVARYYDPEWNFGDCGFEAEIKAKELQRDTCYEILMVQKYSVEKKEREFVKKKIYTNQYLYNGELYRYNPTDFWTPEVEDAEVQEAIQNGTLLGYDLESEIWFYEWNGSLYYVIRFDWFGTSELRPEVPIFVYTTQLDLLPKEEQERGAHYVGDYLSEEDYKNYSNKSYYTGSYQLPTEYAISYITSGVYYNRGDNEGWQKRYVLKFDAAIKTK